MKSTIKKVLFILLLSVFIFCGCEAKESSSKIRSIAIEDLSNEVFYTSIVSDKYDLVIEGGQNIEEGDIKAIVNDNSIIEIALEKKNTYSDDICFTINPLKEGNTSFYFETLDKKIKSESVSITVINNIISLKFSDTDDIVLESLETVHNLSIEIESHRELENPKDYLEFVSENNNVVSIEYDDSSYIDRCIVKPINFGETYVYFQTLDGKIQSEKIRVTVKEPTKAPAEIEVTDDTYTDNSRTVYTTPYGKKYHYSEECAGDNAIKTTEDSAKNSFSPCKKCAQ